MGPGYKYKDWEPLSDQHLGSSDGKICQRKNERSRHLRTGPGSEFNRPRMLVSGAGFDGTGKLATPSFLGMSVARSPVTLGWVCCCGIGGGDGVCIEGGW